MPTPNFCPSCGSKMEGQVRFCPQCGANTDTASVTDAGVKKSDKSALTALLLCLFLGALGIHRFYVGKVGTGILMLLTAGGLGIWVLIDLIRIACSDFKDKQGNYLEMVKGSTPSLKKTFLIIGIVLGSFFLFICLIILLAFYATSGVTGAVRDQLSALRVGNYEKAYSYTSKDFQNETSFDHFKRFIDHFPALKSNKDSTFTRREINNSQGIVSGTIEATDGSVTPIVYRLIKENGTWKILSIEVNPGGVGEEKVETTPANSLNNQEQSSQSHPSEPASLDLPNVFKSENNHYSINYPASWTYHQPDRATVVISSAPQGKSKSYATVNIQTIFTTKTGGHYDTLDALMNNLKQQAIEISPKSKILATDVINLDKTHNRMAMQGRFLIFVFPYQGEVYKQLQFVFLRNDGKVFYTWAYTAPLKRYEQDYSIAKAMFASWSVY